MEEFGGYYAEEDKIMEAFAELKVRYDQIGGKIPIELKYRFKEDVNRKIDEFMDTSAMKSAGRKARDLLRAIGGKK
jgi:hypothetical protein